MKTHRLSMRPASLIGFCLGALFLLAVWPGISRPEAPSRSRSAQENGYKIKTNVELVTN